MDRDTMPTPAMSAAVATELAVRAATAVAALTAAEGCRQEPAAGVAVIRRALSGMWCRTPPEAVRDAMLVSAETAWTAGATAVPGPIANMDASGILEMTGLRVAAGGSIAFPGGFDPAAALASSLAFDRDDDADALTTLSVLLALVFLVAAR